MDKITRRPISDMLSRSAAAMSGLGWTTEENGSNENDPA